MHSTLQERVQQVIDGLVASGEEIGLQVAAYVHGELVVHAWAGIADEDTGRLVNGNTLLPAGRRRKALPQPVSISSRIAARWITMPR